MQAIQCWNLMQNGMGGCDWAALPMACELYEVDDVEAVIERLLIIKNHKPAADAPAKP